MRFGKKGHEKPGVLKDGVRKDCSQYFEDWNRKFFQEDGLEKLKTLLGEHKKGLPIVPESARWSSCIVQPHMILCIGLNYADHAKEAGMPLPKEPLVFGKASNAIAGPYDEIEISNSAEKVDYEIELGVVPKKDVFELENEDEAENAVAGYCITNDLSERSFQLEREGQWIKGKSCPGFCPVGPYLLTKEEMGDVFNLSMQLKVNGEMRQDGNSRTMVFKPAYTIYYLSQFMKLEAGDLILTGTPPGVALGMNPPKFIKINDTIELRIEGLGEQKAKFTARDVQ